jgi:N-acetylglucosaminyldiphosphoundecaprenol N-acetyl-beta-D-mannosaminyltransferase
MHKTAVIAERQPALLGVPISNHPIQTLAIRAQTAIAERSPLVMACANPHSLVVAQSDRPFLRALQDCDEVVADGVGLVLGCRLAGMPRMPRVTGYQFFQVVMTELDRMGGRAFFLGSRPHVLSQIRERAARDYPSVEIQTLSPPYGDWSDTENEAVLRAICAAQPDVLWVGMTAPRQEKWVHANAPKLQVPVFGSIGAVFDYYAGTVHRAPAWYRDRGVEWLYRLVREPRRLWKRTLVSAPVFLWLTLCQRLAGRFKA